jgi:hypothetical protein
MLNKKLIISIPKSAQQERDECMSKILKVLKKYGFNQYLILFAQPEDTNFYKWKWQVTGRFDDILDCLQESVIPELED